MTTSTTLAEDRVRELIAGDIAEQEALVKAWLEGGPQATFGAVAAILSALQSERLRAEEAEIQLSNIRVSFETRGELIENDPFPLWMQVVAAFDQQQARLQALTLERDAMRAARAEPPPSYDGSKPVAWRYRYVREDGRVHWTVTQRPMESQPARPDCCEIIAEPLYAALNFTARLSDATPSDTGKASG